MLGLDTWMLLRLPRNIEIKGRENTKRFHDGIKLYCRGVAFTPWCNLYFFSEQKDKHFEFQCSFHEECVIASYHTGDYAYFGMEQVKEFVTFKASFELQTFIHENKSCPIANKFEREIDFILEYCIDKFSQNIYVVEYNEALQESSIALQEEHDENISLEEEVCEEDDKSLRLGMPM